MVADTPCNTGRTLQIPANSALLAAACSPAQHPHPRPAHHLLQPAALTAELARKFRGLQGDAELKFFDLLLVGLAISALLLVADVLGRALLGHGIADFLLQPVLTLSYPPNPDFSLPLWVPFALFYLSFADIPAGEAYEACRVRRLFWAAVAARRQANAVRLNAKRSGAQQPSTQP